jgi:hypothetical protein
LLFAAVLILGGTLLVAVPRPLNVAGVGDVRAPGSVRGWVGGAAAGLVGLTVCAVLPLGHSCCDGAWTVTLGLPLPWTAGTGDTWGDALSQAWDDPWHPLAAAGDAICWAYAAMVVVMVAGLLRRAQRERFGARP